MSPDYRRTLTQRARRLSAPPCIPRAFRQALKELGWSQPEAARQLGVCSEHRVSDYCRGERRVPPYIAAHLRTHLAIGPTDAWPTFEPRDWPLMLPEALRPKLTLPSQED